jgi:hypothetical protein
MVRGCVVWGPRWLASIEYTGPFFDGKPIFDDAVLRD